MAWDDLDLRNAVFGGALCVEASCDVGMWESTSMLRGIWTAHGVYAGADIQYCCFIVAVPLIWVAADLLKSDEPVSPFVRSSCFIYVGHVFILECFEKLIYILLPHNHIGALVDYIVAPALTLATIFVLEKMLHRSERLWGILTGGRG